MAIHRIMLPVGLRDDATRSVVWDDEAGTVEGDHVEVPWMQRVLAAATERPVQVGPGGLFWFLRDPGRRADEFLVLLYIAHQPILEEPLRSTLPPVFDGVRPPPPEKAELLTDEHGNPL